VRGSVESVDRRADFGPRKTSPRRVRSRITAFMRYSPRDGSGSSNARGRARRQVAVGRSHVQDPLGGFDRMHGRPREGRRRVGQGIEGRQAGRSDRCIDPRWPASARGRGARRSTWTGLGRADALCRSHAAAAEGRSSGDHSRAWPRAADRSRSSGDPPAAWLLTDQPAKTLSVRSRRRVSSPTSGRDATRRGMTAEPTPRVTCSQGPTSSRRRSPRT
jgi:hypothetical protein